MLSNNPFAILAETVSPVYMQSFVILMVLLIVIGTLLDIIHKKNVKYFFENAKKAKKQAKKELSSSEKTSVVQLISDGNFRLSVKIMPSEAEGILRWKNDTICEIFEVKKTSDISIGDPVITSNLSTYFPPNLPIGKVISIHDKSDSFNKT